jgi:hypothetical protein
MTALLRHVCDKSNSSRVDVSIVVEIQRDLIFESKNGCMIGGNQQEHIREEDGRMEMHRRPLFLWATVIIIFSLEVLRAYQPKG